MIKILFLFLYIFFVVGKENSDWYDYKGTFIGRDSTWKYKNSYQEMNYLDLFTTTKIAHDSWLIPNIIWGDMKKAFVCMDEYQGMYMFIPTIPTDHEEKSELVMYHFSEKCEGPFNVTLQNPWSSTPTQCYWSHPQKKILLWTESVFYSWNQEDNSWSKLSEYQFPQPVIDNLRTDTTIGMVNGMVYFIESLSSSSGNRVGVNIIGVDPFQMHPHVQVAVACNAKDRSIAGLIQGTLNRTLNFLCTNIHGNPMVGIYDTQTRYLFLFPWKAPELPIFFIESAKGAYVTKGKVFQYELVFYDVIFGYNQTVTGSVYGFKDITYSEYGANQTRTTSVTKRNHKVDQPSSSPPPPIIHGKLTGKEDIGYIVVADVYIEYGPPYIRSHYVRTRIHGMNYGKSDYTEILIPSTGRAKYVDVSFTDQSRTILLEANSGYDHNDYRSYQLEILSSGILNLTKNITIHPWYDPYGTFQSHGGLYCLDTDRIYQFDPDTGKYINSVSVNSRVFLTTFLQSGHALANKDWSFDNNVIYLFDLSNISKHFESLKTPDEVDLIRSDGIHPLVLYISKINKKLYKVEVDITNFENSNIVELSKLPNSCDYIFTNNNNWVVLNNNLVCFNEQSGRLEGVDLDTTEISWKSMESFDKEWISISTTRKYGNIGVLNVIQ